MPRRAIQRALVLRKECPLNNRATAESTPHNRATPSNDSTAVHFSATCVGKSAGSSTASPIAATCTAIAAASWKVSEAFRRNCGVSGDGQSCMSRSRASHVGSPFVAMGRVRCA